MENEKGLDLSLALPCGGNSYSLKDKNDSSSCMRPDEGDRGSKLINEFKNFLEGGNHQLHLKTEENFYSNFGKVAVDLESKSLNTGEKCMTNDGGLAVVEGGTRSCVGEKRKSLFSETSFQKKHESETNHLELTDKARASHISINTDDGSTAENEDVADSDVDGSTSRQISQHDDVSRCFVATGSTTGSLSKVQKEMHVYSDPSGIDHLGQKRSTVSSEKEFNVTSLPVPYGVSFPTLPGNMANMPFSHVKDSNPVGTPSLSGYSLPGMIHPLAASNSKRPGAQPVVPANFPLTVGYTPVQLPTVDKDNTRGILSHNQHSSYPGWNPINSDVHNDSRNLNQAITHKSFESTPYDGRAVEHGKNNGKQHVGEQGSFSHTGGNLKGSNAIHQVKDASDQPRPDTFLSGFPSIRPGIAADLKFGGCGNCPNLPWVSTTGQGPNGRTISGVTYGYSHTQIRIVCACHGSHMSPEEFMQHASEDNCTPDSGTGLTSLPNTNPAATAQN